MTITKLLEDLKKKDVLWQWGVAEQAAFEELKKAFMWTLMLMMPDMDIAFQVGTNTSDFAVGAVMLQKMHDGE